MNKTLSGTHPFSLLVGIALTTLSTSFALAAGAVNVTTLNANGSNGTALGSYGDFIVTSSYSNTNDDSFAGHSVFDYSAQGQNGDWYAFEVSSAIDLQIAIVSPYSAMHPGVTVWASGNAPFNGGTSLWGGETSSAGFYTPSSFNAVGELGDPGTQWMQSGQGGNLIETLAYAVSGPSYIPSSGGGGFVCLALGCPTTPLPGSGLTTGWGETILHGAHDVSTSNTFENGVSGWVAFGTNTNPPYAELTFNALQPGWYAMFVGGTYSGDPGGEYWLAMDVMAAVPEMETWAMMLAGIGFLGWRMRKQQEAAQLAA